MAPRVGEPQIEVGGFVHVFVAAQVCHRAHVASCGCLEERTLQIARIAPKSCPVASRKIPFGERNDALHRNTGIVDPIFAAYQTFVTNGRSTQGRTWLCMVFTLPKADRIFPTLATKPPEAR